MLDAEGHDPSPREGAAPAHLRVYVADQERLFARVSDAQADGRELPTRDSWSVPDDVMVSFGWMNARAWKHAHENLRFELVRTQSLLAHELDGTPRAAPEEVEILAGFDEQARWLYDRCADSWGAAVIRDAEYLNRRFAEDLPREYVRLGVWDGEGLLRGYAILALADHCRVGADCRGFPAHGRPARGPSMRAAYVADWLVPHDEPEVAELLHEAVLAHAGARHARAVLMVVPEWSRWSMRFQDWGWIAEPTDRLLAVRSTVPRYDMHWLRDHWWYQWAESQLV